MKKISPILFHREAKQFACARADPMAAGPEVELKFLFAEKDVAKVKALVAAASGGRQATHHCLRTVYFDTQIKTFGTMGSSCESG
jgi:hypothetical protein